jgi:biotin carboxyl carrier protein
MTYKVTIGAEAIQGPPSKLALENDAFVYTRADGAAIAKTFSAERAGDGRYSVLIEGRSYQVVLAASGEVVVNGLTLRVSVQDPRKLTGRGAAERGHGRQTIASPMPGRVIRVLVESGQEVEAGQGLIVVEAMKMQNEMKSPRSGTILEIRTAAGAAVGAGEALLVLE